MPKYLSTFLYDCLKSKNTTGIEWKDEKNLTFLIRLPNARATKNLPNISMKWSNAKKSSKKNYSQSKALLRNSIIRTGGPYKLKILKKSKDGWLLQFPKAIVSYQDSVNQDKRLKQMVISQVMSAHSSFKHILQTIDEQYSNSAQFNTTNYTNENEDNAAIREGIGNLTISQENSAPPCNNQILQTTDEQYGMIINIRQKKIKIRKNIYVTHKDGCFITTTLMKDFKGVDHDLTQNIQMGNWPVTMKTSISPYKSIKVIGLSHIPDVNLDERTKNRLQTIHNTLEKGFGFRCIDGNIFISRRCKMAISSTVQGNTGTVIKISRPKSKMPLFKSVIHDIEIFNYKRFEEDFEKYEKYGGQMPYPGIKFGIGIKGCDASDLKHQIYSGEVKSQRASNLISKVKDKEENSIEYSKSNEADREVEEEAALQRIYLDLFNGLES